jgi:cell shape-determining protein MreD
MIYALSWYIQDFLLVLGTGKVLVPEVFLLSMVFLSLYRPGGGVEIIWWAFFGGVLWDLRWLGFPGISSLFYLTAIITSRWVWYSLPASGKTVTVFSLILLIISVSKITSLERESLGLTSLPPFARAA